MLFVSRVKRVALFAVLAACTDPAPAPIVADTVQAATVCGVGPTVKGIDVSYFQGTIDWSAVAGAGVAYSFVRVSDGTDFVDPQFSANWSGSRTAGIKHGAYQLFRPSQDPIAQADLLLTKTGPMKPDDLPPVIDVEVTDGLGPTAVATAVKKWVAHVDAAIGRPPIIYTGFYFWRDSVGGPDLTSSPLWHAQYTTAACPDIAAPWTDWAFWQYTSSGTIAGIAHAVDVDRWNGDQASFDAFLGPPQSCAALPPGGGMIDDSDPCFIAGGPAAYMRHVTDAGIGGELYWTHTTDDAIESNYGDWNINLTSAGSYRVDVYTAAAYAQSKQATYEIIASGAKSSVTIDQSAVDGWQTLGTFDFAAGATQSVHLADNTGEPNSSNVQLVFDAIRLVPAGAGDTDSENPETGDAGTAGVHHGCSTSGGGSGLALIGLVVALVRRRKR